MPATESGGGLNRVAGSTSALAAIIAAGEQLALNDGTAALIDGLRSVHANVEYAANVAGDGELKRAHLERQCLEYDANNDPQCLDRGKCRGLCLNYDLGDLVLGLKDTCTVSDDLDSPLRRYPLDRAQPSLLGSNSNAHITFGIVCDPDFRDAFEAVRVGPSTVTRTSSDYKRIDRIIDRSAVSADALLQQIGDADRALRHAIVSNFKASSCGAVMSCRNPIHR